MAEKFYENFEAALDKLIEFSKGFDGSDIQRAGIIQAFEFTFEQCWKSIQKKAGTEGIIVASPKKSFQWAMQNGWIENTEESIWIEIISDRNLTSHTYRAAMAIQVSQNVMSSYLTPFQKILANMKK